MVSLATVFVCATLAQAPVTDATAAELRQKAWTVLREAFRASEHRELVTAALARVEGTEATQLLLHALNDKSTNIRGAAARVLRGERSRDVLSELSTHLEREPDFFVRTWLIEAIGSAGDASAIGVLSRALRDPDRMNRAVAFKQLKLMGGPAVTRIISGELSAIDKDNRRIAASILGENGDTASIPALKGALSDPSPEVREEVAIALAKLADATGKAELNRLFEQRDERTRLRVAAALWRLGDTRGLDALTRGTHEGSAVVRAEAMRQISESTTPGAMETLASALVRDSDSVVRSSAAVGLALVGREAAKPALRAALNDKDELVRLQAAKELLSLGDRSGTPVLMAALNSASSVVKGAAFEVAADFLTADTAGVLEGTLREANSLQCVFALQAIGKLRASAMLPDVENVLEKATTYDIVMAAAETLAEIAGDNALGVLATKLDSRITRTRIAVAAEILRLLRKQSEPEPPH